jgi:hypothetical protein
VTPCPSGNEEVALEGMKRWPPRSIQPTMYGSGRGPNPYCVAMARMSLSLLENHCTYRHTFDRVFGHLVVRVVMKARGMQDFQQI